jgi:hypothetical protein
MERNFKGVWIPAEIWLDKRLTICEKAFLAEVDSFTGNGKTFHKSNQTIEEEYGIAPRTVQRMVKKLVELGMLESEFNGRVRHLSTGSIAKMTGQGRQNDESASPKWRHTNTVYNTIDNTSKREGVVLPFDSREFAEAWEIWLQERRERRIKKYTLRGEQAALHKLHNDSQQDEATAIAIIHQSIANGWQGLFPLKHQKNETKRPGIADGSLLREHLKRLAADSGESLD